jgi:hypothetical protein
MNKLDVPIINFGLSLFFELWIKHMLPVNLARLPSQYYLLSRLKLFQHFALEYLRHLGVVPPMLHQIGTKVSLIISCSGGTKGGLVGATTPLSR